MAVRVAREARGIKSQERQARELAQLRAKEVRQTTLRASVTVVTVDLHKRLSEFPSCLQTIVVCHSWASRLGLKNRRSCNRNVGARVMGLGARGYANASLCIVVD